MSIRHNENSRGFTLIELMIVMAIMAIMTSVVLLNYKIYTSDAALGNIAQDMALNIRQTQLYGISAKESSGGSTQFSNGYGIHFVQSSFGATTTPVTAGSFITYFDANSNSAYDSGESVVANSVTKNFAILKVCKVLNSVATCTSGANDFVDLEFIRPNPDMIMTTNIGGSVTKYSPSTSNLNYYSQNYGVQIYIGSNNRTRIIYVDKTGQISVKAY